MSKEKGLVERKLGIINKIRKRFFLRKLSEKKALKYRKLPEELKNDEEIITAVWSKNEEILLSLPIEYQKRYIKEAPTYFFDRFENDSNFLEVLEQVIIESILKGMELPKGIPFDKLLEKTQLKLMLIDNKYIERASEEAISKFVGNNSLLIEKAPANFIYHYIHTYPEKICNFTQRFQNMKIEHYAVKARKEITDFKDMDELKKYLILKENNDYEVNIFDIEDDEYIWEMGKFDPELIYLGPNVCYNGKFKRNVVRDSFEPLRRCRYIIQNIINHAKIAEPEGEITKFLERYLKEFYITTDGKVSKDTDKANEIMKFLLNDKIVSNVSQKEIFEYIKYPTNNGLAEIVRKAYGNQAAKIIEDRPEITSKDIQNFYIFDEKIIEEFGIGAVHATLSYDMKTPAIFSEFARFPEKIQLFKEFRENMQGTFGNTAIDLEKELKAFIRSEELIKDLNGKKLTETQKEDLQLAIYDTFVFENSPIVAFPQNVEELNEYKEKRDKIYDECIEKLSDPLDIKDMISRKYFCMRYKKSNDEINSPSVRDMLSFYNIPDFIKDDKVIQNDRFSQDDLDALEVMCVIFKLKDPKILKEISKELGKNELIINPEHYKNLKKEIPLLYNEKLIEELINPEKVEKMIKEGEEGVSIREEEGIKIITLKGIDFTAYITKPYLNNSEIQYIMNLDQALKNWKNMENGISTFSGSLIDANGCSEGISKDCRGDLGFFNIRPEQISAMGSTDIRMSHSRKQLSPTSGGNVSYADAKKIIEETSKDGLWPYNEVASHRRIQKLNQITEDTYGGKIMPDYIYIYGVENTTPTIIETAKKHGIKYIFEYDYKAYEQKKEINFKKEHRKNTPRPQSEFMKKVNKIQETGDKDERE